MTRRLLTSYVFASLGTGLPWPLLLVLVWDQYGAGPHGVWVVGLAGAARMAPYVLFSWAVGSLGDHVRRDLLIRTTYALRFVCLGAAAVAVQADRVGLAVVAAALAVTVGTPTYPAIAASLPTVAGAQRARATEVLVTIEVSSWVVGPALGGLMLAPATRPMTLVAAAALAVVGWALILDVRIPGPAQRAPDAVAGMLRAVTGCPPAVRALAVAGSLNLALTAIGMALLPLSRVGWDSGDAGFGVATAFLGFGALGAPLLARLVTPTVPRGLAVVAGAVLVVAVSPVPWVALVPLALGGASAVVVESVLTGTLQEAVPDRYRAGALGVGDTVMVGACLVGSLLTPTCVAVIGARPTIALAALLAVAPATWRTRPSRRRHVGRHRAGDRTSLALAGK